MLVVFEVIGYYISGMFLYPDVNMSNYQEVLVDIFMHPMKNYWNEKTRGCLYLAAFGWVLLYIISIIIEILFWEESMGQQNGLTLNR